MKKGLVLLFAFILTAAFSAEVFAAEMKTNFGIKKRDKKAVEQRLSQERVKKVPLVQPIAEATVTATTAVVGIAKNVTDTMYSAIVDNVLGKIGQMKQEQASGPTKAAVEKPRETKRAAKQGSAHAVSKSRPQETMRMAEAPEKKERIKREVEPKRRKSSNIK